MGDLARDFRRLRGHSATRKKAPHPTSYAQKPIVAGPTGAKVALTVLSFVLSFNLGRDRVENQIPLIVAIIAVASIRCTSVRRCGM